MSTITDLTSKTLTLITPYSHIQHVVEQYLRYVGAVKSSELVTGIVMPMEVDSEDMVEITVGVLDNSISTDAIN